MELIAIIDMVRQQADRNFSMLSQEQLNWKPAPEKWSIAQCLQHLIISDKTYFPSFDKILNETHKLGFFQKLNPFKNKVGELMVRNLGPAPKKKYKAPAIFRPTASSVSADIVSRFISHQHELKNYFERLLALPTCQIHMASPVTPFIVYSLAHAMQIIAVHEQRHLEQGMNVLNHPNFPK